MAPSGRCELCQPGHFCPDQKHMEPCRPGFYADDAGMVACISCDNSPNVGFANATRALACTDCPSNTERTLESSLWGGSRAEECVCKVGFYEPLGRPGLACLPCPVGGYCAGGAGSEPRAQPGFWGIAGFPDAFTPCGGSSPTAACELVTNASVEGWFRAMDRDRDGVLLPEEVARLPALAPALADAYAAGLLWGGDSAGSGDTAFARNVSLRGFLSFVGVDPASPESFVPTSSETEASMCAVGFTGEACSVCEPGCVCEAPLSCGAALI
jgi:hypothetical protein